MDLLPGETLQQGPPDASLGYGSVAALEPPYRTLSYSQDFLSRAPAGSPAGLLERMLRELDHRAILMAKWNAYYEGDQPLAFASERFRDAFGGRFRAFSSNFCALVVDGTRERMEVSGFTFQGKRSTKRAWDIWQANDMDAQSQMAHTEALIKGIAYTLVEPQPLGAPPLITVEDPVDAITVTDPRSRRIRAGLKRWQDDQGHLVAFVYTPEFIWKVRTRDPWTKDGSMTLEPFPGEGEDWPLPNTLGVVPMVPLPNRPRLRVWGQSEVAPVMSNQDAVNKYRADALVAAEFAAFRQRWATGLDIPVDPATGQPLEPFKAAVDRLWVVPPPDPEDPNPMEAKFGEFSATDLQPYQRMIESEVGAMSSISRLPYHYLLGQPQSVPPSGESLKSSEAGLIAKVRTAMVHFGEGWEQTLRLALLALGDPGSKDYTATTAWKDPETRNEAAHADSTVKVYSAGIVDRNEARMALGYQPQEEPPPAAEGGPEESQEDQDQGGEAPATQEAEGADLD